MIYASNVLNILYAYKNYVWLDFSSDGDGLH